MKLNHPAVTSDVFKLVTTLEFDLEIGDHFLPTRVEVFRNTGRPRQFRCRLWERDLYRLEPTCGQPTGTRARIHADEEVLVERTWELSDRFEDFTAASPDAALKQFLDALRRHLDRFTPQK